MRHGKKFNHLGRTAPHRGAMLSNMASSLILNKRISTTVAKAKALRKYVEPLLTKAKNDDTHSRRLVFSYLQNKESIKTLFEEVAEKIASRPGGYTRILKTGNRLGDNAEMCIIELVDYNEALLKDASAKGKTRRSRRGKAKAQTAASGETAEKASKETKPAEEVKAKEEDTTDKAQTSQEAKPAEKAAVKEEGKPKEEDVQAAASGDASVETKEQDNSEGKEEKGSAGDKDEDTDKK